ncbi:MAG: DUF6491 family protein [Rhodanobacter sp.]|jgi:hypothetical protein
MSRLRWLIGITLAGFLVACSSVPYAQRQQQRQAAYLAAAGMPVQHFRFMSLWSWEPLSDSQVVIYTRPNQAWLLDLDGPCQNLQYTNAIGLTSGFGQVSTRFDKVLTGRRYFPCTIQQIRPVDVARLKIEQQAQRKIDSQPRNQPSPAGN